MNNASEQFNRLYTDVADNISNALGDIASLDVQHKDGKREIGNITEKLSKIQDTFNQELHLLKDQAEWDTFTLAFFGETNAGKSTILESLRILFKEESRQDLLEKNADDLEQFSQALTAHLEHVRKALHAVYIEYAGELTTIKQSTDHLTRLIQQETQERNLIVQAEADERNLILQQEAQTRLQMEQQEAANRLQIKQVHAESRFKLRLALFGLSGILIGATSAVAFLKFTGG